MKEDLKRERNIERFVCNTTNFTKKYKLSQCGDCAFQSIVFLVCMIHGMSFDYFINNHVFAINLAMTLCQKTILDKSNELKSNVHTD